MNKLADKIYCEIVHDKRLDFWRPFFMIELQGKLKFPSPKLSHTIISYSKTYKHLNYHQHPVNSVNCKFLITLIIQQNDSIKFIKQSNFTFIQNQKLSTLVLIIYCNILQTKFIRRFNNKFRRKQRRKIRQKTIHVKFKLYYYDRTQRSKKKNITKSINYLVTIQFKIH